MNDPDVPHGSPPEPAGDDALEQRTLAWLFGEDDEDPGLIADEAARRTDFVPWLDAFARDHVALKAAIAPGGAGLAQARLAALLDDITRRRAGAVDWSAARGDNVRSLAAARARPASPADVRDAAPRSDVRARRARIVLIAGVLAAAAAVLFVMLRGAPPPPDVDARVATLLVAEVAPDGGLGFAGAAPSARDRGFLLGAVLDLSRPRKDQSAPAAPELSLARELANRTLVGLDAPDDAEAQRQRVIGGCAAILVDPADRRACEKGLADYIARRDAFLIR